MKVIAINSSPNMDKGYTNFILAPFLDGIREANGNVETFYTNNLTINPCLADLHCWNEVPGECIQKDDMTMLLPKLEEADIWVFATPVYFSGVTGPMKNLMDRMLPIGLPVTELRNGHSSHPSRKPVKGSKVVLVSACGLFEKDNFDPVITHMKAFCWNVSREFAGALIRPHGWIMEKEMPEDITEASKNAGRQLIEEGKISSKNLDTISRDLVSLEKYIKICS